MTPLHLESMPHRFASLALAAALTACPSPPEPSAGPARVTAEPPATHVAAPPPAVPHAPSDPAAHHLLRPADGAFTEQLRRAAAQAQAQGDRAFVLFHASWCAPCQAFERARPHPLMQQMLRGVMLLEVDIDEWDRNQLTTAGFDFTGIPTFFALDGQGHASGRRIDSSAWRSGQAEGIAPVMHTFFSG